MSRVLIFLALPGCKTRQTFQPRVRRKSQPYCDNSVQEWRRPEHKFTKAIFFTAQLHPLWGRECLTSHPRQKTGQASTVTAKGCFVYIQGDLDAIPFANLSCWNSSHTWPTELWFFSGLEALGLVEALARGRGEKSGLPSTPLGRDPWVEFLKGSLFWIGEKVALRGGRGEQELKAKCPSELLWCV